MRLRRTSLLLAAIALLAAPASPAAAQDPGTDAFTGQFQIGFRSVDVGGNDAKYREDINLEDGPRLFDLDFDFRPEGEARALADEIRLDINNFGGDPFETLSLSVRKHGAYDFRYDRRKSTYFYEDTILPPALANANLSTGGDFHTFDFDRVRDTAHLGIQLSRQAKLSFGFERYTKEGESTTTLDIQRDEFELDRPVDESLNDYIAGFEYSWDKATLVLEERVRDYENLVEIFLPGQSLGETPDDATVVDFFFLDQPYDYTSYEHTARFVARPTERFSIQLAGMVQDLSMDVEASESSQGTDFRGNPFTTGATGEGEVDRDAELFDLDLTFRLSDRFALVGGAWYRSLDQDGAFTFGGTVNEGFWEIDTSGGEAGLQVNVSPTFTVAAGLRYESRDVTHGAQENGEGHEPEEETTDRDGYFATLAWRPTQAFNLTVEAEDSSYDDPFTLASPTSQQRLRARGRYRLGNGFSFSGTYLYRKFENDNSGWTSDRDQFDLRLAYQRRGLSASVGYAFVDVTREIDQVVVTLPGFGGGQMLDFPIFYEIDTDFVDGHLRWQVSDRFAFGGDARFYDNGGSFALTRDDLRGWLELGVGQGYLVHLGYRTVDYDEDAYDFDDYDADIVEVGVGYRW